MTREILERGIKEKDLERAIESYRAGRVNGWKAAQQAGVSLWNFYKALAEKEVLIQYPERDLEENLRAPFEE